MGNSRPSGEPHQLDLSHVSKSQPSLPFSIIRILSLPSFLLHSNIIWTGCCHMSQALLSIYGTFNPPESKEAKFQLSQVQESIKFPIRKPLYRCKHCWLVGVGNTVRTGWLPASSLLQGSEDGGKHVPTVSPCARFWSQELWALPMMDGSHTLHLHSAAPAKSKAKWIR